MFNRKIILLTFIFFTSAIFGDDEKNINYTQLDGPISSFCSTSLPAKLRIFTNFQFVSVNSLYDGDGKEIEDGKEQSNYDGFGNIVSTSEYNLDYSSNVLFLYFDYFGEKDVGFELSVPVYISRELNNDEIDLIGVSDFKFGIYYIWEQFFIIKKMKSAMYYQYSKTGYTISNFGHLKSVGQKGFGLMHSVDLLISDNSFLSFKSDLLISSGNFYDESDSTQIYTPDRFIDIVVRYKNNILRFFSYSLDFGIYQYNFEEAGNDKFSDGRYYAFSPHFGFKLLKNKSYGYFDISHIDFVISYSIPVGGKNYVKPNTIGLSLNTYFE
ncbi:MAG: hypothetical protein H8E98_00235 [Bacteroidetes bacterium]|nr:hypothetical protein [Bacteroidota bacterium]